MKKQEEKAIDRFLTLNHNENSNKNININISYNMHRPFHRRLQTENYNPNNSLTSNDPRSTTGIKGKKIDNKEVDCVLEQDRLLHKSLSKDSNIHNKMRTEQADEQCEISIKVIKKKKPALSNQILKGQVNNKLRTSISNKAKNKTSASMRVKNRVNTQQTYIGPSTTTHKNTVGNQKNFFSTHENMNKNPDFQQLIKHYKENRRKSLSCSKEHSQSRKKLKFGDHRRTIQQKKDLFYEMIKKIKKSRQSKESLCKKQIVPVRPKKNKIDKLKTEVSHNFKKDKKKMVKSKSLEKAYRKKKQNYMQEERFSLMNPPRKSLDKHFPVRHKTISQCLPKYDIDPLIISKVMNSSLMSDSIKMSSFTSKELSDRRQLGMMQETLTLNKHSIELTSGIREMREIQHNNKLHMLSQVPEESSIYINLPQEQIPLMNKAAAIIKQRWHEFRRQKIIYYYNSIFQKNQSVFLQEDVLDNVARKIEDDQEDVEVASYKGSFDNEGSNEQSISNPFKDQCFEDQLILDLKSKQFIKAFANIDLNQEHREIQDSHQHGVINTRERTEQEEESQFDIINYKGGLEHSLKKDKSAQGPSLAEFSRPAIVKQFVTKEEVLQMRFDKDDIHKFKQQQLEQWNHINKLINRQLNQNEMDPHVLLHELMKQSEMNKKWIEQSCEVSQRNEKSSSLQNSRAESPSSQRSEDYRNLFEERGIADRLKRNSQDIKQLLCHTYEIDKSERSLSCRSNSVDNLQDKEFHDKNEKLSKGGNSSKIEEFMTYKMMNDNESEEGQIAFQKRKKREKNELIDQFLDCGLNECGFEDRPYLPVGENSKNQSKHQIQIQEDEELRRRSRNLPINGDKALLKRKISSPNMRPQPFPVDTYELQEQQYTDEILVKITNNEEPQSILINQNSLLQSFDENQADHEPISKLFKQQRFSKHGIFQSIYHTLLEEFCIEIGHKSKFEKNFCNYFSNNKMRSNKEKGISTSYASMKAYLVNFVDYLINHPEERVDVLKNINTRLGPTSTQMLYYLRLQDSYSECQSEETEDEVVIIIPYETFQRFEFYLDRQQAEDLYRNDSKIQGYTFNWHRALFEGFNESLDQQRPFGTQGRPYAWEVEPRMKNITITEQTLQKHLELAASKVLEVGSFLGGILFDKEDSPYGPLLSEEQRMQINEDRLSRILAAELYEAEEIWIYYNDEKLELMLELSSLIYERVIFEAATDISKSKRRKVFLSQSRVPDSIS